MTSVAILSNPKSTGNRQILPKIRAYCASNPNIFHYEVDHVNQIGRAIETISRVNPRVIVINGGDGTVQSVLTEMYQGGHFAGKVPPVAVIPNGKTNLIAHDLGMEGDPIKALDRIVEMAGDELERHLVTRELISLSNDETQGKEVLGMFLGGAGLVDSMLYCRHKIYPLGLPNSVSHFLTACAVVLSAVFGIRGRLMPPAARPISISLRRQGELAGRFSVLIVTTLEKLLLGANMGDSGRGQLRLMAVDQSASALLRMIFGLVRGRIQADDARGIHMQQGDTISIEGEGSVILDGEIYESGIGRPILLRSTEPVPFLRIAA